MVQGRCLIYNCDHVVKDGQHIDDVLDKLAQHYRGMHPTKAFYRNNQLENLETYNLTLQEVFDRYWGVGVNVREREKVVLCRQIIARRDRRIYCESTYKEVEDFLGNNVAANQPEEADANVGQVIDEVLLDDLANARWQGNVAPPMPAPAEDF